MAQTVINVKVWPPTADVEVQAQYQKNAILLTGGDNDGEVITDSLNAPVSSLTDTAGLAILTLHRDSNMVQVRGAVQQIKVSVPEVGYSELVTIPDTTPEDLSDISPIQ